MSKFEIPYLTDVFSTLGQQLSCPNAELTYTIQNECQYNAWFTAASVEQAVTALGQMLNKNDLQNWLGRYKIKA
ncbi:MAG: hypothetical protein ACXVA2_24420, partial [Mucilaginibacter sp.]